MEMQKNKWCKKNTNMMERGEAPLKINYWTSFHVNIMI
jgi:hypothetical protein